MIVKKLKNNYHSDFFHKIIVVFCFSFFSTYIFATRQFVPFENFDKKIEKNRDLVEDVYYRLVKNHYFDDASNPEMVYSNNLIMSTNLDDDSIEKGTILLNLIIWLEKKNDAESRFLLRKINRLYFLEFHRSLSGLDYKNDPDKMLLFSSFHELSRRKNINNSSNQEYPFRTAITKAVLTLFVINKTLVTIGKKRESALYLLEKIKQEMLFINKKLCGDCVNENVIYYFIAGLEKFGVVETLVESKFFRNFVMTTASIMIVVFVVYKWDVIGAGLKKLGEYLNEVIDGATKDLGDKLGNGLANGVLDNQQIRQMRVNINDRVDQIVNEQIQGIRNDIAGLRNDAGQITEQAMRGALRGVAQPDNDIHQGEDINPDLKIIADVVVGQAVDRALDRVQGGTMGGWLVGSRSNQVNQQSNSSSSGANSQSSSWFGGLFGGGVSSEPADGDGGGFGFGDHGDSSDGE